MSIAHFGLGILLIVVGMCWAEQAASAEASAQNDARARRFIQRYEQTVRPLEIDVARRWWDANISGSAEDYRLKEEAETRLEMALADREAFAEVKAIREGPLGDAQLARQIHVLYLQYLARQVDPELLKKILAKSNAVERQFNVYRARVDGKELTDNEVRRILRESKDSALRQAVWEASKQVGRVIEPGLRELVRLRNQAAARLGFPNYHVMQLYLGEQSQEQVLRLFDELDRLTREPFRAVKREIDAALAKDYGLRVSQLRPWHYHDPFFQEAPTVFPQEMEAVYAAVDILRVCREFYAGIGLPVDNVLARSDLYEKKGKNPHAFCLDMDRAGDVRVLANIVPNRQWLSTMLHELGHAVYTSQNMPAELPYALRTDSHPLTTEGVAMMFERFTTNADWLRAMGVRVPDPHHFNRLAAKMRRQQLLIFSRWCQVMFRFEKALYENPEQDLNRLWWELVERYQELVRPEGRNAPDYAAKIHIVSAPAYYHNYMLGEMFASQVHRTICSEVLKSADPQGAIYAGNRAVGEFMRKRVFAPGRSLDWNQLARHATGEELSAKAFAADFQGK